MRAPAAIRTDGARAIRQSAFVAVYASFALVCSFVFGGGLILLALFGVCAVLWLGFTTLSRRADRTARLLLRQRGYY